MKKIRNWPVMAEKCASCPFRQDGDHELAERVLERTILQASQICHHPVVKGKKETHLCRGARDVQLQILHGMGWIDEPTDDAFAATSRAILGDKFFGMGKG